LSTAAPRTRRRSDAGARIFASGATLLALLAAWLDTYEEDERLSSEKVTDGEWITQVEAQRLAAGNGYELEVDD
jgi:hypothetical protein